MEPNRVNFTMDRLLMKEFKGVFTPEKPSVHFLWSKIRCIFFSLVWLPFTFSQNLTPLKRNESPLALKVPPSMIKTSRIVCHLSWLVDLNLLPPFCPFRVKAGGVRRASCWEGGRRLNIAVYNHASTFSFIQSTVQATQAAINTH